MFQQGVLHCEVCNAELPNFDSMRWHIQGKRHQNALEFWKTREEQASLSVFVRGFPHGTSEQEIWQYFSQFGRVSKVALVKPKNLFAIVEFCERNTVEYVLNTPNHRLNSQNLVVRSRDIEVPGRPPSNQYEAGYQQFQRRGGLGEPRMPFNQRGGPGPRGGGRGMLAFGRGGPPGPHGPRGPRGGMAGPGPSYGWQHPPEPMWQEGPPQQGGQGKNKVNVDEQIDMYYHEELIEKLVKVKGVQNQLEWLCQTLQVTADEAQLKFNLCEKLQTCLGQFFPGCTVNQFGSSVNGFGLTGCDMDIFLDLSTMHSNTWEVQPIKLPYVRDFKHLKEKEWGPLVPKDLDRMGMQDECRLICRIINENLEGVMDVQVVPSQRCPLVRFKYTGLDTKCDLSINNKMALQNTKLLYLYSVLNSRVRLLVYAIRYWGKIKGLAGNNQSSTKLSNYALTLMVLNYLQNVEPPVLPTIEKLSQLHGPNDRVKIEGWDVTFAMDWQIIPQSSNNQTAAELLSGFFSYWSAFNFTDSVLISRTAKDIAFTEFFDKCNMTDGRIRNFKASAINIQDPFVLMHNITQNVNEKMREKIDREFRIAAIKTSVWGNEGFSMMNPSGGGDLVHLLNNEVPDIILQEDQEKHEQVMEKGRMPARKAGEFEFDIELKPQQMTSKILKQLQKGPNFRVEWCRKMCFFVCRILREVLLLTLEELVTPTEEEKEKIAEEMKKKEAADKRNEEIKKRRKERKQLKREKLQAEYEEQMKKLKEGKSLLKAGDEKEEEAKEGENGEKKEGEEAKKEGEEKMEEGAGGAEGGADVTPGTSGSSDQAGDKRPRPVSILDIEMDTPKRFKGQKSYQFNIDDYIEYSDDEEEIIEYKPDVPELSFKRESDAEVDFQYFMRAWCMTWARRKKVKNYLVNDEGRREDGLKMEKLISNAVWRNDRAPLNRPVVGFYCYMESHIIDNETKVRVSMDCREGERDFNTFFQFTKMYLYKMIDKYFN